MRYYNREKEGGSASDFAVWSFSLRGRNANKLNPIPANLEPTVFDNKLGRKEFLIKLDPSSWALFFLFPSPKAELSL
jgi:hypothetical protein